MPINLTATSTTANVAMYLHKFLKIGTWLDLIWCIDPIYAGYNGDITKFDTRHRDGTGAGILEITE